jgi:hypothetical protein
MRITNTTGLKRSWEMNVADVDLSFRITDRTGQVDRLTIKANNGNVGIGDTNPLSKLTIKGNESESYLDIRDFEGNIKFLVGSDGSVGIGTTSPSYLLSVNGTLGAKEIVVTDVVGADFVFEDNYKLMSLEEVEKFVKKNKHLPDIAPAKEMEKKGVSVGEMQSKLLQKIEELTLYVIEQNKMMSEQNEKLEKLDKLEKENELLKKNNELLEKRVSLLENK